MKRYRLPLFLILVVGAVGSVKAQTWNTNQLQWVAPTECTSNQPIANCAITGYRVERSATSTGTFASVGTSLTTSFTHSSAVAGQNCYRVVAMSAKGDSQPSNVACKTNVEPSGPPKPPTNLTVSEPTVFDVRPNETTFAFDRGRAVGIAKIGSACDEDRTTGGEFYALERPSRVRLTRTPRSSALVAKCG